MAKRVPGPAAKAPARARETGIELDIIGSYPNPYLAGKDPAAKAAALARKIKDIEASTKEKAWWAPDIDDFSVLANQAKKVPREVKSVAGLLGTILSRSGKIRLLNIITHSASEEIALKGDISSSALLGVMVHFGPAGTILNEDSLAKFAEAPFIRLGGRKFTIADIQGKFTSDAVIVINSCKGGATKGGQPNPKFLNSIAQFFGVRVLAFDDKMWFCRVPTRTGLRFKVGIGSCDGPNATEDFRQLVNIFAGHVVYGEPSKPARVGP